MSGRVTHFEIHAQDPERAAKFYTEVFGWEIKKWQGPMDYWLITTGREEPGINGAIMRRMGDNPDAKAMTPVVAFVCTVGVDNLDKSIAAAVQAGGTEAMAKMPVPGMGWLAYYKDTESNIFGMMQSDETAK